MTVLLIPSLVVVSEETKNDDDCTIYLAPSTIEGAGLGIFTSIPLASNTVIGVSDVIVPIIDLRDHHPGAFFWLLSDYVWDGIQMMGMQRESDPYDPTDFPPVDAFAPGFDCAINCHLGILNVDRTLPSYDTNLPHRSKYPSAGSMTSYWNSSTFTITDVPAGAELFKFYGDDWFMSRPSNFKDVPLSKDYPEAEALLKRTKYLMQERWGLSEKVQRDLYDAIVSLQSPVLNALPRSIDQMDQVLEKGISSILQPHHLRDNLQDMPEARCMESIVAGQSLIEGAGRGGFAAWSFQEGEVITGSPLIHIHEKELLNLFSRENRLIESSHVVGKQLLMNYCWGHPETALLLCPYGSGVNYINHSRKRANVKIQWAPNGHIGQDDAWFHWSLRRMTSSFRPNLAWDFIALRDIAEGEEILIDYGDEWVDAWEEHVAEWQTADKPSEYAEYKSAAEWNELFKEADIRTEEERLENPYPDHIDVVCHTTVKLNTYLQQQKGEIWDITMDGVPCRVNRRQKDADDETYYTVGVVGDPSGEREKVHRKMLRFRDQHYSTDMHLEGAFRKEATIPDDMLPVAWRRNKRRRHDEL